MRVRGVAHEVHLYKLLFMYMVLAWHAWWRKWTCIQMMSWIFTYHDLKDQ